jgi:hypothetical protein
MPRVPTVDGPSVAEAPLPNGYQQTPQGLGQVGNAQQRNLQLAGQAVGNYVEYQQREQNRADLDAVFRAETALKDDYISFERDELGKQGENAKGAGERSQQWWGEAEKKYADGLTERQATAYRRSATRLRQASAGTLGRHEQQQGQEALKESSQARIGTAINVAIGDPTPERVAAARTEIAEAVNIVGNMQGQPPEVTQRKLGEAVTLMHRGVVMHLVDSDPDAAKAYYYTHKKEIDGGTRATLEKTLERGGQLQKAQEAADTLVAKFGDDVPAAMAFIEKTYQGEDEKAIKAEFKDRYTTVKSTKQQMSQTAYETALLNTVQGQKVPAAVWSQMDDGHKAAIVDRQRAEQRRREAEANGKGIKTDWSTWDKLNRMVTEDPAGFTGFDLGRVSDRVSRQDLEEFGKLQRKLRAGDDKPLKDAVTLSQQVDQVADGLKLKPNTPEHASLRKSIYDEISSAQERADKPLDYKQRQEIIDRVTLKAVTSTGLIWDTEKRVYEMTPAERAKMQPTSEDRAALIDRFKKRGVDKPTDEQVLQAFRTWKGL